MRMKSMEARINTRFLDLDEQLVRYWLTFRLADEKRIELQQHLEDIRLRRQELMRLALN